MYTNNLLILIILLFSHTIYCQYPLNNTVFDYIVVGSGSSGSIVASRLAENGSKVLVIEGGGGSTYKSGGLDYVGTKGTLDPTTSTYTPKKVLTKYDVPLFWTPAYITGAKWNITGAGVAKICGGCGVHNGMVFQRGRQADYDEWNIPGWSWNDILPFILKLENITDPDLSTSPLHGHSGRLQIGKRPLDQEGINFLASCTASGLPINNDFANNVRDGCGNFHFNIDQDGIRSSSFHEYLEPALDAFDGGLLGLGASIKLIKKATVLKVLISLPLFGTTPKADGVLVKTDSGQLLTYFATKEVILAAGALNTPKILLQSGIGNSTYLSSYSSVIPHVWSNLPGVGRNLQDHFLLLSIWNYTNSNTRPNYYELFTQDLTYSTSGSGILGTPGVSVGAWLRSNATAAGVSENLLIILPGTLGATLPFPALSLAISIARPKPNNTHYIDLTTDLTGSTSDFMCRPPKLHFDLLNEQEDVDTMVRGLKEAFRIMSFPPMSTLATPVSPASVSNTTALEEFVRASTFAHEHWVGTAKMGNTNDPMAVVDPNLKVIGVNKLRVVDASVIPIIPDSLPHVTVMAIAEKAAQLIIQSN